MQPVLIAWEYGGNLGHLARLLPIARTLRKRGHPVTFAVRDPASIRARLSSDISVVQIPLCTPVPAAKNRPLCPSDLWLGMGFVDPESSKGRLVEWLELLRQTKPAAIIVDASPFALYAAHVAGIPSVSVGHGYDLPPPEQGLWFAPWMDEKGVLSDAEASAYRMAVAASEAALSRAMAKLGELMEPLSPCEKPTSVASLMATSSQVLTIWPELDHFERQSSSAVYAGPIWDDLPNASRLAWPDRPGRKVLCYLNLRDKRYDTLWSALEEQAANAIVLSPQVDPAAADSARAKGICVYSELVQVGPLLEECDAVIGEGGIGFTSLALALGKPLLLIPTQLEQSLITYRLSKQGLAMSTINFRDAEQMKARVMRLLTDDSFKAASAKYALRYSGYQSQFAVERVITTTLKSTLTLEDTSMHASLEVS